MDGPEIYVNNAIGMWTAYGAQVAVESADLVRFEMPRMSRVILRRPLQRVDVGSSGGKRLSIEDSFSTTVQPAQDFQIKVMPVMVRPAGPIAVADGRVGIVDNAADLAEAERVIVEGFPQPAYRGLPAGEALPLRMLTEPGFRVWLAHHNGKPGAAAFTYDDGTSVGVYWLATLPQLRGLGLARAIMTRSLAAHSDRPAGLVATSAGTPLYESLGFVTVSTATWYIRVPKE